jgi:hypothetical protein
MMTLLGGLPLGGLLAGLVNKGTRKVVLWALGLDAVQLGAACQPRTGR